MREQIESPGSFSNFDGGIEEFNKTLNAFRLVRTGAVPELANIRILEVPPELQKLPVRV